ncbi:hypothetical protein Micbo1qcDRAFT_226545 [Microdochium bolleyi]|uniref:Uncharacterized protein n=1 Tax=Microdochium bolleyi TaxID=196109 RepID=A0A136J055_9PEZI|nr:hypothetical protein Micbo1qcDRAFT_226545 [Microdochium bolleyi]
MPFRAGSGAQAPPGYSAAQRVQSSPSSFVPTPVRRIPTDSSYHSFDGVPWDDHDPSSQTWMYASDAREQQSKIAAGPRRPYPSRYGNSDDLPLTSPGMVPPKGGTPQWLHHPLIPGQQEIWKPKGDKSRGAVRSFYTRGSPEVFDVGHHNPKAGLTKGGTAKFTMATYHTASPKPIPADKQGPRRGSYN